MNFPDDQKIVDSVLQGRTERFALLVDRYSDSIYRMVMGMVGRQEEAQELTQDAFVKAFSSLPSFRWGSSFSTWLYRIAYTTAVSALRKRKSAVDYNSEIIDAVSDTAADSLLDSETDPRLALLPEAIDRLAPADRALLTLYYYDELSLAQAAGIMGITLANAKTKLMRTRRKLFVIINELSEL